MLVFKILSTIIIAISFIWAMFVNANLFDEKNDVELTFICLTCWSAIWRTFVIVTIWII